MKSRRRAAALAVLLALLGSACGDGPDTPDGFTDEVSAGTTDTTGDADAGTSDATDGDDTGPDAEHRSPQVPALLPAIDDLDETVVTMTTSAGDQVHVDAKVAATTEEQRQGLMHVPELPDGIGMLFVFDDERSGGFWMFNTLVPLDIAYIDDAGEIGTILAMDPCGSDDAGDCPSYTPDHPYSTALEVPQGWFREVGISTGDQVRWTDPVPAS